MSPNGDASHLVIFISSIHRPAAGIERNEKAHRINEQDTERPAPIYVVEVDEIDMIQITKTIVFSGSILIAGPTIALAQVGSEVVVERPDSDSRSTYGLQLEAATELPLFVGGRLQFRLPGRLHVGAGLGALPGGLLDATSGVVTSVARLDEGLSALVTEGLDDGWMAKTYIGWTPFFGEAFYVQAGYAYLGLNGGLNAADLGLLGVDLQGLPVAGTAGLGAALHAGELELGFRWAIGTSSDTSDHPRRGRLKSRGRKPRRVRGWEGARSA
ncbi:MAG: hypothetical protein AAFZ18_24585 [Myxococcota bacterium]